MSQKKTSSPGSRSSIKAGLECVHQAGNATEREREIELVIPMVVSLATRVARLYLDLDTANEIGQEVAVKFYQKLEELFPERSPAVWVATAARNAAIDRFRRAKHAAKHLAACWRAAEQSNRQAPAAHEEREDLRLAIESLPLIEQVVVTRHYLYGELAEDIADAIGVPRTTVYGRLASARKRLRKILEH